jgi:formylglycine-generating enzyme required for sulfatase activity
MAFIEKGSFVPQYTLNQGKPVFVKAFWMDITPVSNAQFLQFVKSHPTWKKSKVSPLFSDENYLHSWKSDTLPNIRLLQAPVTNVSWYAAKAYCECQGKRLPTTDEWEYVAMASPEKKDARKDSVYTANILMNYQRKNSNLLPVGRSKPNIWGVYNLNELVWEWTEDFNSVMFADENQSTQFCGAGALRANNINDYPAFIRYAFRNALKANFGVGSLGFRCVK